MVEVYVKLVRAGKRTLLSVPEALREQVRAALESEEL